MSVPLAGGEARTLYQAAGDIAEVVRAGDRIAFIHTGLPSPEQLRQQAADRKAKKIVFGARGESHLMSIPLNGGEPTTVGRSRACSLPLTDPNASKEHLQLAWEDGAWVREAALEYARKQELQAQAA